MAPEAGLSASISAPAPALDTARQGHAAGEMQQLLLSNQRTEALRYALSASCAYDHLSCIVETSQTRGKQPMTLLLHEWVQCAANTLIDEKLISPSDQAQQPPGLVRLPHLAGRTLDLTALSTAECPAQWAAFHVTHQKGA